MATLSFTNEEALQEALVACPVSCLSSADIVSRILEDGDMGAMGCSMNISLEDVPVWAFFDFDIHEEGVMYTDVPARHGVVFTGLDYPN